MLFDLQIQITSLTSLFDSGTNIGRIHEYKRIHECQVEYLPKLSDEWVKSNQGDHFTTRTGLYRGNKRSNTNMGRPVG